MNAVAPAQTFELISCERGLGRLQTSSCAKRWRLGNAAPGALGAAKGMDASGIRNSPCRACPHGEARAKAGAHEVAGPLIKLEDVALVAPGHRALAQEAREPKRPRITVESTPARAKARVAIEKRLGMRPTAAARPATAVEKGEPMPKAKAAPPPNGRRCVICDAALYGRSFKACHGDHQAEYYRRASLAIYWRGKGDEAAVAAVMRGELPSGARGDAQKRKVLDRNVKSVEPATPAPPHVQARVAIEQRLSDEPAVDWAVKVAAADARLDRAERRHAARMQVCDALRELDREEALDLLADLTVDVGWHGAQSQKEEAPDAEERRGPRSESASTERRAD